MPTDLPALRSALSEVREKVRCMLKGPWKIGTTPFWEVWSADGTPVRESWFRGDAEGIVALKNFLDQWGAEIARLLDRDECASAPHSPILYELHEAGVRDRHKDCAPWTRTGHSGCDVPDLLNELERTRRALYLAQDECGKRGQDLEAVKLALACSRDNEKALRIKLMEAARLTREAKDLL